MTPYSRGNGTGVSTQVGLLTKDLSIGVWTDHPTVCTRGPVFRSSSGEPKILFYSETNKTINYPSFIGTSTSTNS